MCVKSAGKGKLFLSEPSQDCLKDEHGTEALGEALLGSPHLKKPSTFPQDAKLVTPEGTARSWLENKFGGCPPHPKAPPSLFLASPGVGR